MRSVCLVTIVTVTTGCPGATATTDPITDTAATSTTADPGSTAHTGPGTTGGEQPTTGEQVTTGEQPTTGGEQATTHAIDDTEGTGSDSSSSSSTTGGDLLCGNGVVDDGEQCDDGNLLDSDACIACAHAACGDGFLHAGIEACDDGNLLANDGCSPACEQGPGAELAPLALQPGPKERFECMAIVDKQHLGGHSHGLTLGSVVHHFGPENQAGAYVRQLPLKGGAIQWSYLEYAGIYGRWPAAATTAPNGDVIVAGRVLTEAVQVDSGGYLWLARFSPAGEIVWSRDVVGISTVAFELDMTSDGDIVFVGSNMGFASVSQAHRFRGSDGQMVWTYEEQPSMTHGGYYADMALDDDDNLYIVGSRHTDMDFPEGWVFVRALDPDGGELWEIERSSPQQYLRAASIAVTTDEHIVFNATESVDVFAPPSTPILTALDLDGALLWSKSWNLAQPQGLGLGSALAAPDGGFYLTGGYQTLDDTPHRVTARFDAVGLPVWVNDQPGAGGGDLQFDPDGILHILTQTAVVSYLP